MQHKYGITLVIAYNPSRTLYLGVISMHLGSFRKVKVQNGEYFFGLVKFQIFFEVLEFLIFFFWGGGG